MTHGGSEYCSRFRFWLGKLNWLEGPDVFDRLCFVYGGKMRQAHEASHRLECWCEREGVGGWAALESVVSGSAFQIRMFVAGLDHSGVPIPAQPCIEGCATDLGMASGVVAKGRGDAGLTEQGRTMQPESPQATWTQPSLDRSSHSPATDSTISPAATPVDGGAWQVSADGDSSVVGRPMARRRAVSRILQMTAEPPT